MGQGAGVDDDPLGDLGLLLEIVYQGALVVGLAGGDLHAQLPGAPTQLLFYGWQGHVAIDAGVSATQGVEVGAIDAEDTQRVMSVCEWGCFQCTRDVRGRQGLQGFPPGVASVTLAVYRMHASYAPVSPSKGGRNGPSIQRERSQPLILEDLRGLYIAESDNHVVRVADLESEDMSMLKCYVSGDHDARY